MYRNRTSGNIRGRSIAMKYIDLVLFYFCVVFFFSSYFLFSTKDGAIYIFIIPITDSDQPRQSYFVICLEKEVQRERTRRPAASLGNTAWFHIAVSLKRKGEKKDISASGDEIKIHFGTSVLFWKFDHGWIHFTALSFKLEPPHSFMFVLNPVSRCQIANFP